MMLFLFSQDYEDCIENSLKILNGWKVLIFQQRMQFEIKANKSQHKTD
jgi:hypothetical protein